MYVFAHDVCENFHVYVCFIVCVYLYCSGFVCGCACRRCPKTGDILIVKLDVSKTKDTGSHNQPNAERDRTRREGLTNGKKIKRIHKKLGFCIT